MTAAGPLMYPKRLRVAPAAAARHSIEILAEGYELPAETPDAPLPSIGELTPSPMGAERVAAESTAGPAEGVIALKSPADILAPGGSPVGRPGASGGIRRLTGGLDAAQEMFEELVAGGKDVTPTGYPGKLVELPGGGRVGLRPVSSSGDKSPSIDINIPGIAVNKIHFEP